MEYNTKLRCYALPLNFSTLVAHWNQPSSDHRHANVTILHPQGPASVCISNYAAVNQSVPLDALLLSSSACRLLGAGAGAEAALTSVTLTRVTVKQHPKTEGPAEDIAVSPALASMMGFPGCHELFLVPATYSADRLNLIASVSSIVTEPKGPGEPVVYMHRTAFSLLGCQPERSVQVYFFLEQSTPQRLRLFPHPGYLFVNARQMTDAGLNPGDVVRLKLAKKILPVLQIHPVVPAMMLGADAYAEAVSTQTLFPESGKSLRIDTLKARLHRAAKLRLDEVQNKARAIAALPSSGLSAGGLLEGETVQLFCGSRTHTAVVRCADAEISDWDIELTPLLLRELDITVGCGVFIDTEHRPRMLAKVGIFNIDEVGRLVVIGSTHLDPVFKMPCAVEIRNPSSTTSLDIELVRDPHERAEPMVRMSRSTRKLLLVERGAMVLIKQIDLPKLGIWPRLTQFFMKAYEHFLEFLIGSRAVLMSVAPAQLWDDEAELARVSLETLAVLGMQGGDRARIIYRQKSISRIVLANKPSDTHDSAQKATIPPGSAPYEAVDPSIQISLDAGARFALGQGYLEFGTVVAVKRDKHYLLRRSLNLSIFPIIGTVITIVALFRGKPIWLQSTVGVFVAIAFFFLALSVERSKVR